jgi:hypothetical protein
MRAILPLLLALVAWPTIGATQVVDQQTGTNSGGGTLICPPSASVAVNQQETVICTPPPGAYVYITGVNFDVCTLGDGRLMR